MTGSGRPWFRHEKSLLAALPRIGLYWGIPVSWQGRTVLALLAAGITAAIVAFVPDRWPLALAAFVAMLALYVLVATLKGQRVTPFYPDP